jgi:sortase B
MQTKYNPEYYLKRNFYKEYSSYGTPFLAGECNLETSENLIIYGHHMQNSKMFGTLENYKSKEYYDNHKIINFYTLDDVEKYEIFAVFKTTLYQSNTFKYYQNIELDTEEDYLNFINQCCSLSFYNTNIIPEYKDKLITLSTCEYSAKNSRLVVVARQITN